MIRDDVEWDTWYRPARVLGPEEISFHVTGSRDFIILFKKENSNAKRLNYLLLLGISTTFVVTGLLGIQPWLPKSIFIVMGLIAIYAVTAKIRIFVLVDQGVLQMESYHFGVCTAISKVRFADDSRFKVTYRRFARTRSTEFALSNAFKSNWLFNVRSGEDYVELVDSMNAEMERLISSVGHSR